MNLAKKERLRGTLPKRRKEQLFRRGKGVPLRRGTKEKGWALSRTKDEAAFAEMAPVFRRVEPLPKGGKPSQTANTDFFPLKKENFAFDGHSGKLILKIE